MGKALDYAKYFIKGGFDSNPNTYDGNMKLNKLLVFADLISMAENHKPLFDDKVLAFVNGCVVENVRQEYKTNYHQLKEQSEGSVNIAPEDKKILDLTTGIFGNLTARELSELNHQFSFWKSAYNAGTDSNGYHNKAQSEVSLIDMKAELDKVRAVVSAYKETQQLNERAEIINGVYFYYDPDELQMTDSVIDQLEVVANKAENGDSFSVYLDNGKLVVY